jgi:hypothetical protein
MLAASFLMFALAATGFAQIPAGYRKVYITSLVNTKFVLVPKSPPKSGTTMVVFVSLPHIAIEEAIPDIFFTFPAKLVTISQSNSGISKMAAPKSSWQIRRFA